MPTGCTKPNVFVVATPFQLLNAIEAAKCLDLTNNYLVILEFPPRDQAAFAPLIKLGDWARVYILPLGDKAQSSALEVITSGAVRRLYERYHHWRRRQEFTRFAKSFGQAANLLLGHYDVRYVHYMLHLANNLKHEQLYLLDDGTETIEINNRRKTLDCTGNKARAPRKSNASSILYTVMSYLRAKYVDWNLDEAASVTFFTTYDLAVKKGDHLVKNSYTHLKSLAGNAASTNEVCFLGQCFVEAGYMKAETYLAYMRKAKAYFGKDKVVYAPHPMESSRTITEVADLLGFEIRRFGVPIEVALTAGGYRPRVLASFNCSALESCSTIFGSVFKILSFRIAHEHLQKWGREAGEVYEYFRSKNDPNFEVIDLDIRDPRLDRTGSG